MMFGIWLYLFARFGAHMLDYDFMPPFFNKSFWIRLVWRIQCNNKTVSCFVAVLGAIQKSMVVYSPL